MSRWRMTFWLDDENERDYEVGQAIVSLKAQRKFVSTIRDGVRLIMDLRAGRTGVLFELFPHLESTLKPTAAPPPDNGKLEREIADLKRLITEQGGIAAPPAGYPVMKPSGSGIQPLKGANAVQFPTFEDDDTDTVIIRRDPNAGAAILSNFMNSVGALNS